MSSGIFANRVRRFERVIGDVVSILSPASATHFFELCRRRPPCSTRAICITCRPVVEERHVSITSNRYVIIWSPTAHARTGKREVYPPSTQNVHHLNRPFSLA